MAESLDDMGLSAVGYDMWRVASRTKMVAVHLLQDSLKRLFGLLDEKAVSLINASQRMSGFIVNLPWR